jgi:hypothetical protein
MIEVLKSIIYIILGILILFIVYKYPAKKSPFLPNLSGIIAGLIFISIGIGQILVILHYK